MRYLTVEPIVIDWQDFLAGLDSDEIKHLASLISYLDWDESLAALRREDLKPFLIKELQYRRDLREKGK